MKPVGRPEAAAVHDVRISRSRRLPGVEALVDAAGVGRGMRAQPRVMVVAG